MNRRLIHAVCIVLLLALPAFAQRRSGNRNSGPERQTSSERVAYDNNRTAVQLAQIYTNRDITINRDYNRARITETGLQIWGQIQLERERRSSSGAPTGSPPIIYAEPKPTTSANLRPASSSGTHLVQSGLAAVGQHFR